MGRARPGSARARTGGAGAGQESCRAEGRPGEPAVLRGATGAAARQTTPLVLASPQAPKPRKPGQSGDHSQAERPVARESARGNAWDARSACALRRPKPQ